MCAWSCLPVKNPMTLNFGSLLLAVSAEQQQMSAAMRNVLRADMVMILLTLGAWGDHKGTSSHPRPAAV